MHFLKRQPAASARKSARRSRRSTNFELSQRDERHDRAGRPRARDGRAARVRRAGARCSSARPSASTCSGTTRRRRRRSWRRSPAPTTPSAQRYDAQTTAREPLRQPGATSRAPIEACESAAADWAKENGERRGLRAGATAHPRQRATSTPGALGQVHRRRTRRRSRIGERGPASTIAMLVRRVPSATSAGRSRCVGRYREAHRTLRDNAIEVVRPTRTWGIGINLDLYRINYFREIGRLRPRAGGGRAVRCIARHEMGYRWGIATALPGDRRARRRTRATPTRPAAKFEEALAIRRELGEPVGTAETLASLGRLRDDRAALEEAFELAAGDRRVHLRMSSRVPLLGKDVHPPASRARAAARRSRRSGRWATPPRRDPSFKRSTSRTALCSTTCRFIERCGSSCRNSFRRGGKPAFAAQNLPLARRLF